MNAFLLTFLLLSVLDNLVLCFQSRSAANGLSTIEYASHKNSKFLANTPTGHKLYMCVSVPLLFDNQNPWIQYALIASSAGISLKFEKTKVGQLLSAPVCSMLLSVILTNVNILPSDGSIHIRSLVDMTVKLATPLLLLNADLKRIYKETGSSLFFAFLLGTVGTIIGSIVSYSIFGASIKNISNLSAATSVLTSNNIIPTVVNNDGWKLVSALTAKNIGGGLNYMGVANALQLSPLAISLGLAVDNVMGLLYFPFVSYLASFVKKSDVTSGSKSKGIQSAAGETTAITTTTNTDAELKDNLVVNSKCDTFDSIFSFTMENLIISLALGLVITASAEMIAPIFHVSSISFSTFFTVIIATLFPTQLKSLIPVSDLIGKTLLMLFFAAIGNLSGLIYPLLTNTTLLPLFLFNFVLYAVHMSIVFIIGSKVFKFPLHELIIASNANIGNAATASSLAVTRGWKNMIVPALLVGTLGNAIGTIISLFLGKAVFSKMF